MAAVTIKSNFGAQENKASHCFPIYLPWSDGTRCHDLSFWMLSFKPVFPLSSFVSSIAQSCPTLSNPMNRSTPGLPVHHQLPELAQTHVHWVGDAIQPSQPVVPFSSCPQSFPASGSFPMSQFFASGGQSIGVSASASVLPALKSGPISFRMDWLDVFAVQGTLKGLLQHHSSKVLRRSAFFMV